MDKTGFLFAEVNAALARLGPALVTALRSAPDPQVAALADEAGQVALLGGPEGEALLVLGLVGQYDAGKSTILRGLTGRKDIRVNSDVCTDTITAYDWSGVRILDTPGVHAGYPAHDESTTRAIASSDLLVFVITNELFDETIGRHFRELVFEGRKAAETLLVVNKMSQDPGIPEAKRPDIEKVTRPYTLEDFGTVFIDARCWLDAKETLDEEERVELAELSNFPALIGAINGFVKARGILGRATTPIHRLRAIAVHAAGLLSTDTASERMVLELLQQKRRRLLDSRSRLRAVVSGHIASSVGAIAILGDRVAEAIEPGSTEADVKQRHGEAQVEASALSDRLGKTLQATVEDEIANLRKQLEALGQGELASRLKEMGTAVPAGAGFDCGSGVHFGWNADGAAAGKPVDLTLARKISGIAGKIGDFAKEWSAGPGVATAKAGSMTASRGSAAHKTVYAVGKFFGAEFKPWGAVKVANVIGKVGTVLGLVGGILGIATQIYDDVQEEKLRVKLRDARNQVRSAYHDAGKLVETQAWKTFDAFDTSFYSAALEEVDGMTAEIQDNKTVHSVTVEALGAIAGELASLLTLIQA